MIPKQYLYYSVGGFIFFFMFMMWTYSDYRNETINHLLELKEIKGKKKFGNPTKHYSMKNSSLKYILIWTLSRRDSHMNLGKGQKVFIKKKCPVTNCYVTTNKELFNDTREYDVLIFNVPEIHNKHKPNLPTTRSSDQLFVFGTIESSDYYPLCDTKYDNYFNLTWTYKLDSDIFYGYMIIRNKTGDIIGPSQIMHWEKLEDMAPTDDSVKEKLKNKSIAAAWFVSNCKAPSGRDNFVKEVQRELDQFKLAVDVYGSCGNKKCPTGTMAKCWQKIESDYYFYFSFENSFSDDYVTEKLLYALNNYAVPVVYGTANYTRFMPDGIYLNALELGAKELAKQMSDIIKDKERYYNFFRWRNHYSYHYIDETAETDPHCKLCKKVNNNEVIQNHRAHKNLKDWWNPKKIRPRVCPR